MAVTSQPEIKVSERQVIAELALRLTGSKPESDARLESCIVNILRRMGHLNVRDFNSYLVKVAADPAELGRLVSALTIHHTSWFREAVHLEKIRAVALEWARDGSHKAGAFTVLSAGCSSGEEAYSIGLVLQKVKSECPSFDYRIEGWDVDPVSVQTANRAIYPDAALSSIPASYHGLVLVGSAKTKGMLTLDKAIRDRCSFKVRSLLMPSEAAFLKFQVIFCRNVLIYFKPEMVQSIIYGLLKRLNPGGTLVLGHSEAIEAKTYHLEGLGNSCYRAIAPLKVPAVQTAKSASLKVLASKGGAALSIKKPPIAFSVAGENLNLCRPNLILIGASTGGTDALERLLKDMPADCPPIVIVQHIAHAFARSFAERLATVAGLTAGNPHESSQAKRNHIYMSWGDYHVGVRKHGASYILSMSSDPPRHSVRPSVDYLFESASKGEGCDKILVCLLTGMGKDGAAGMLELRRMGAMTCTQDEKSSVVFGMPAEAAALGASQFSGSPEVMRSLLLKAIAMPDNKALVAVS